MKALTDASSIASDNKGAPTLEKKTLKWMF